MDSQIRKELHEVAERMLAAINFDTQLDDVEDMYDRMESLIREGGVPMHVHDAFIKFAGAVYAEKGCMCYTVDELARFITALEVV